MLEILHKGDFQLKIIDFSNSCWTHHIFSKTISTRASRAPEILLGMTYNEKVDIWSCACLFFKLLTMEDLFYPEKDQNYSIEEDHLAQIFELVHEVDTNFISSSPKKKVFLFFF